jgi:hypothetical protein
LPRLILGTFRIQDQTVEVKNERADGHEWSLSSWVYQCLCEEKTIECRLSESHSTGSVLGVRRGDARCDSSSILQLGWPNFWIGFFH